MVWFSQKTKKPLGDCEVILVDEVVQIIGAGGKAPESSTWHQKGQFHMVTRDMFAYNFCPLHSQILRNNSLHVSEHAIKIPWVLFEMVFIKCRLKF